MDRVDAKVISIHALREEGDSPRWFSEGDGCISIHALREEGDPCTTNHRSLCVISIHALREEGDNVASAAAAALEDFYPRPPRGGRRGRCGCIRLILTFLSTPSARRATSKVQGGIRVPEISIHALREEGDKGAVSHRHRNRHFYPRPPRGGRPWSMTSSTSTSNFYPRPPRGGRRGHDRQEQAADGISIHALREEGDQMETFLGIPLNQFLSTPSARRATHIRTRSQRTLEISIHALREEGDLTSCCFSGS